MPSEPSSGGGISGGRVARVPMFQWGALEVAVRDNIYSEENEVKKGLTEGEENEEERGGRGRGRMEAQTNTDVNLERVRRLHRTDADSDADTDADTAAGRVGT